MQRSSSYSSVISSPSSKTSSSSKTKKKSSHKKPVQNFSPIYVDYSVTYSDYIKGIVPFFSPEQNYKKSKNQNNTNSNEYTSTYKKYINSRKPSDILMLRDSLSALRSHAASGASDLSLNCPHLLGKTASSSGSRYLNSEVAQHYSSSASQYIIGGSSNSSPIFSG